MNQTLQIKNLLSPPLQNSRTKRTLTQNLKTMGLWVLLLIRRSTFTFLSDVGHITHTCTQHSTSSVSSSIHLFIMLPLQGEVLTCLYRRCWILRIRTGCLDRTLRRTGAMIPLLGHEGSLGTVHIKTWTTILVREMSYSYPKP